MITAVDTTNLADVMEFDHVIEVQDDGTVRDRPDLYAPDLFEDELTDDRWEFFSTGYTGQYLYNGPIMHNSEFIGGRLAQDILDTPGVYVAVVSYYYPEYPEDGDGEVEYYVEGWAIARLKD
jgi:hypothetical protein